jgi:hypothetical protein
MLQVQIVRVVPIGNQVRVSFNVIPSGNYVTGGDTLDFTQAIPDPTFFGGAPYIPSSQPAVDLDVWDVGGNIANGVFPVIGSAQNNNKVKFTSAFNAELAAGAYPASITGSKLMGEAIFTTNQ